MIPTLMFDGGEFPVRWFRPAFDAPYLNTRDHAHLICFGGYDRGIFIIGTDQRLIEVYPTVRNGPPVDFERVGLHPLGKGVLP